MTNANDSDAQHNTYRRTRDAFDRMNVDEQASFLIEATASVLARGVEHVGRTVASGLDDLFCEAQSSSSASPRERGPGPAEPETSQQRRPRGGRSGPSAQ